MQQLTKANVKLSNTLDHVLMKSSIFHNQNKKILEADWVIAAIKEISDIFENTRT